jgi:hypothetical protein
MNGMAKDNEGRTHTAIIGTSSRKDSWTLPQTAILGRGPGCFSGFRLSPQ